MIVGGWAYQQEHYIRNDNELPWSTTKPGVFPTPIGLSNRLHTWSIDWMYVLKPFHYQFKCWFFVFLVPATFAEPVKKYPDYFVHGKPLTAFLETYPYALPSFICASFSTLMLVFAVCFVRETLSTPGEHDKKDNDQLLQHTSSRKAYSTFSRSDRVSEMVSSESLTSLISTKSKEYLRMFSLDDCMTMAVLYVCVVHIQLTFQTGYYQGMCLYWTMRKAKRRMITLGDYIRAYSIVDGKWSLKWWPWIECWADCYSFSKSRHLPIACYLGCFTFDGQAIWHSTLVPGGVLWFHDHIQYPILGEIPIQYTWFAGTFIYPFLGESSSYFVCFCLVDPCNDRHDSYHSNSEWCSTSIINMQSKQHCWRYVNLPESRCHWMPLLMPAYSFIQSGQYDRSSSLWSHMVWVSQPYLLTLSFILTDMSTYQYQITEAIMDPFPFAYIHRLACSGYHRSYHFLFNYEVSTTKDWCSSV